MKTMRAAVCVRAGGPEVLELRELPVPAVREGWRAVGVARGERLLIRGGTSSVGMAAASIAPALGAETAATTRRRHKAAALVADHVLVDDGGPLTIEAWPEGPDHVLHPHVDRVFSVDDVAEAHRYLEDDQATGKVVLVP
ncbi:zinc-binding dehydrogenase [Amycolatopsis tucumanensis]|uniref:zinc-binding dehydrogenase n=1 Tax=Amycolatopsis tucumanensis TaxID=401106 RepID=UPI003D7309DA